MSEKIELKEKLAAVDIGAKDMWDAMDATQQKALTGELFILNRYISSVSGQRRDIQEHFVLTVNEFYNKNWAVLQKHPKLLWMLLCMCGHESRKVFFHKWIGFKQVKNKRVKFLSEVYPEMKDDEIDLLSKMMSIDELTELALDLGHSEKDVKKMF